MSLLLAFALFAQADGAPTPAPCADAPDGMSCIPGGPFIRGYDDDNHRCQQRFGKARRARPNARGQSSVWLQTFYMDVYEVTIADYEACIKAKGCTPRKDGRWGPLYTDFSRPTQPVTGTSWFHAKEYCEWVGKHLPTEAQWEKAARGPDGEINPWGNEPANCELAVIRDPVKGRSCGVKKRGSEKTGRVIAIGSRPAARYGLHDMVGNVEEWVADWYTDDWTACGDACAGPDPLGPCDGEVPCKGYEHKVVRGGSWYWDAPHGTGYHRRPHFPENNPPKRYHHFGFRCAASLEEAAAMSEGGAAN